MKLQTKISRVQIERQLEIGGYTLEFEDRDDQIWMNKEQDKILFISWINISMYVYRREKVVDLTRETEVEL